MIRGYETADDIRSWTMEAGLNMGLVNAMVDKVMREGRGVPIPQRFHALMKSEPGFTAQEATELLCGAIVALAVEREKP